MTYADTPVYSSAPVPAAITRRVCRDRVRRHLSSPLMALALFVLFIALLSLSLPLALFGGAAFTVALRWSGEPLQHWVDLGPLRWL